MSTDFTDIKGFSENLEGLLNKHSLLKSTSNEDVIIVSVEEVPPSLREVIVEDIKSQNALRNEELVKKSESLIQRYCIGAITYCEQEGVASSKEIVEVIYMMHQEYAFLTPLVAHYGEPGLVEEKKNKVSLRDVHSYDETIKPALQAAIHKSSSLPDTVGATQIMILNEYNKDYTDHSLLNEILEKLSPVFISAFSQELPEKSPEANFVRRRIQLKEDDELCDGGKEIAKMLGVSEELVKQLRDNPELINVSSLAALGLSERELRQIDRVMNPEQATICGSLKNCLLR